MASIGIDLGGTKILAVLAENGEVLGKHKLPTPSKEGPEAILDAMSAAISEVDPHGIAAGIGVGVPGPVLPDSGVLSFACNLFGWTSLLMLRANSRLDSTNDRSTSITTAT